MKKILDLVQGTPEWLAARAAHYCASDAPAMLGLSKYKSRTELLREKKTGLAKEVDANTQALFDHGHKAEAQARPEASKLFGAPLSPKVCTEIIDGMPLLASLDGVTEDWSGIWEHKLYAQWIADFIDVYMDLPDTHWPQVEHQLLVSGATEALFMASNGIQSACVWYESQPERRARVIAGWKQFAKDLETFVVEDEKPEVVAAPTEALPTVYVQLDGNIAIRDNLDAFGSRLKQYIDKINKKPETDQDFADAEAAIKVLSKAEEAIANASSCAIEQASSLADMQRKADFLRDLARETRLALEKLVKREKEARKAKIVNDAKYAFIAHIDDLNASFGMVLLRADGADFAQSIKGLRTIASMENAVGTALAQRKIDANEAASKISYNLALYRENSDHAFLFNDISTIALRPCNEFAEIVQNRITTHRQKEEERMNAERERIRREEQARAEREAKERADREARERAEAEALAKQEQEQAKAAEAECQPELSEEPQPSQEPAKVETVAPADTTASNDEEPTLSVGEISRRLGFTLTAAVIEELGIHWASKARGAVLYRAADFPRLCTALIERIRSASEQSLKKAA